MRNLVQFLAATLFLAGTGCHGAVSSVGTSGSGSTGVSSGSSASGSGSGFATSGAGVTGISTGGSGAAGSTSSSGGSSSGGPNGPFRGEVDAEHVIVVGDGGAAVQGLVRAIFLPTAVWPTCAFDAGPCCFLPEAAPATGLSAGPLTAQVMLADGGSAELQIPFDPDAGSYSATFDSTVAGFEGLSAGGGGSPGFDGGELYRLPFQEVPEIVLTPDLAQLSALPTGQDWVVPLTPAELEFLTSVRVELSAAGVGRAVCQVTEETRFFPPLVVPAAILAPFSGRTGEVAIHRDDNGQQSGPGGNAPQLEYRVGVAAQTPPGQVSFTP